VGGNGFIGRAIVNELMSLGHECKVFDIAPPWRRVGSPDVEVVHGSILDREAMQHAFRGAEEVYHLAGELGTSELEDDPAGAVRTNVLGAINVFDAALGADVPCVFYPTKPNLWLNVYSITKHAGERFAQLYSQYRAIAVPSLRYFNAFGPGQHLTPVRKLVPTLALQAIRRLPLQVFGDGQQTVDMIPVADLAALTVAFTRTMSTDLVPDCGRGVPVTVNEIAAQVNACLASDAGIDHLPMRPGEPPGTTLVADPAPLLGRVGPFTFTDWDAAITDTLEWYARLPRDVVDKALTFYGLV
jgi:UDP-glucose 4-epimerase